MKTWKRNAVIATVLLLVCAGIYLNWSYNKKQEAVSLTDTLNEEQVMASGGMILEQKIYEVSQINEYIKQMLDSDEMLGSICVRGELSNYKIYPSGHHYFTMKDAEGSLRCVMFKSSAIRLRFRPENGMKVLAMGRVTVFLRDGAYQLYCTELSPDGVGDLYVAFEQLKRKLSEEGLFDPAHKKPLPAFPHRIAIITSGAGAAVMDMLRILGKRYPLSKVMILPVRVQGAEAPAEIAGAIRYANRWKIADVIITGRGGGSMEDLWAFNDERVARAIFDSEIPVVSAVGHGGAASHSQRQPSLVFLQRRDRRHLRRYFRLCLRGDCSACHHASCDRCGASCESSHVRPGGGDDGRRQSLWKNIRHAEEHGNCAGNCQSAPFLWADTG